jgi:hypothetical protein
VHSRVSHLSSKFDLGARQNAAEQAGSGLKIAQSAAGKVFSFLSKRLSRGARVERRLDVI